MRSVSSTVGSGRCTMPSSTEAAAGARLPAEGSRRTSGCQAGGVWKRMRSASGVQRAGGTAGRCASVPLTGTRRGSKPGPGTGGTGNGGTAEEGDWLTNEAP